MLVRRWLRLLGVPRRDRWDIAQNVMLAAHESFGNYDPELGPSDRWLNKIAVHAASHYGLRERRRREEPLPDDFDAELDEPSAEEQIISECDRLFVLAVLRELDAEFGAILMAHDIEGVPMADFASRAGIPLSTAYKRRSRALAAFQQLATRRLASMPGAETRGGGRQESGAGPPRVTGWSART
ncbi:MULTISPECIES: sigma-70 family RNA polymerase sigma factor [Sorangium]|uniref:Sigma-70 family RNA polymerase sigma factor n=1 Tax=Sorangium atrum TaxID=2995308 RepID=A0ABT5CGY0_9BACT|nr:sigma-70 family RNA polymerase sigma factor [Sorangium aterium]MDC0685691.1 sigma-70 family RNA polymerase sigma factor [Sorangium aterium]